MVAGITREWTRPYHLFHEYLMNDLPRLLLIRNNKNVFKVVDFNDDNKIATMLNIYHQ